MARSIWIAFLLAGMVPMIAVAEDPPPAVVPNAQTVDFGTVALGNTTTAFFVLTNSGTAPAEVQKIPSSVEGQFNITPYCPIQLFPGEFCEVQVDFVPNETGIQKGKLELAFIVNGEKEETAVTLLGTVPSQLSANLTKLDFGMVSVGASVSTLITIVNDGLSLAPSDIQQIRLAGDFSTLTNCPTTLMPGQFCQIQITFSPLNPGKYSRELEIEYVTNGVKESVEVAVKGTGFSP